jgi:hypothetical protein
VLVPPALLEGVAKRPLVGTLQGRVLVLVGRVRTMLMLVEAGLRVVVVVLQAGVKEVARGQLADLGELDLRQVLFSISLPFDA